MLLLWWTALWGEGGGTGGGEPLPPLTGNAVVDILRVRRHRMRGKGGR